jgi:DNA-binding NtrC family response regulator
VDVRIVCATNRDLRGLVSQNQFRADLFFRIAILSLFIPPLCDRAEDIELLSAHFVDEFGFRYRKARMTLAPDAIEYLRGYVFEGNVRELQGMIERAVVICEGNVIGVRDLMVTPGGSQDVPGGEPRFSFVEGLTLKGLEDEYIDYVYNKTNGSIKDCSSILGIDRTTLWRRIKGKQARQGR